MELKLNDVLKKQVWYEKKIIKKIVFEHYGKDADYRKILKAHGFESVRWTFTRGRIKTFWRYKR